MKKEVLTDARTKSTIVNREIFIVKTFSDSMASAKIKRTKIMCIINDDAVRGHLSKNYLTRKFIARNMCDTKYSQFTVLYDVHACMYNVH